MLSGARSFRVPQARVGEERDHVGQHVEPDVDGGEDEAELVGEYIYVEFWDLFDALDDDEIEVYADFDYYQDRLDATSEVDLTDSCGTQVSDSHEIVLYAYGS